MWMTSGQAQPPATTKRQSASSASAAGNGGTPASVAPKSISSMRRQVGRRPPGGRAVEIGV
eukprot:4035157-Lingulodinium_polyedra.AAC.1